MPEATDTTDPNSQVSAFGANPPQCRRCLSDSLGLSLAQANGPVDAMVVDAKGDALAEGGVAGESQAAVRPSDAEALGDASAGSVRRHHEMNTLEALVTSAREARAAWEVAVEAVEDAQVSYDAHEKDVKNKSGELEKRQRTAAKQKEGTEHARRLNAECSVLHKGVEGVLREKAAARAALEKLQGDERRLNDALDAAVAALNTADTLRRGEPEKWVELNTRGGTVFRKSERPLKLSSVKTVGKQTAFRSIFNSGFKNRDLVKCPDGVGDRWHGRKAVGSEEDAAWVAPFDSGVTAWLGEDGLNWLATTTGEQTKAVVDTHALKAGVDSRGKNATTPEQRPLHADSCWPNSHVSVRAPWGDAHLVMITALQEGTRLPIYPFDKGGEREIVELNAGDVFLFRGDLVHVGAEYMSLNIRIHCYIDSPCAPAPRDNDATYHVLQDSWPIRRR
jgi:hypothetical protein